MKCPRCESDLRVQKTKPYRSYIERRRQCLKCKFTFTSLELASLFHVKVHKSDFAREERFQIEKVVRSIEKVSKRTEISGKDVLDAALGVQKLVLKEGRSSISSRFVAKLVLDEIRRKSHSAARRYAVNYEDEAGHLDFSEPTADALRKKSSHYNRVSRQRAKLNDSRQMTLFPTLIDNHGPADP